MELGRDLQAQGVSVGPAGEWEVNRINSRGRTSLPIQGGGLGLRGWNTILIVCPLQLARGKLARGFWLTEPCSVVPKLTAQSVGHLPVIKVSSS